MKRSIITILLLFLGGAALEAQDTLPPAVEKGELLYANTLSARSIMNNWVMEGPGTLQFKKGWMEMFSPGGKWDHVLWCPQKFPASFIAEWEVQNLHTEEGLLITFFAATGDKGQSIFDPGMPARDGTFKYYNRGRINCYHISYYANNPKLPDRGDSHLRKDPAFALLQTGKEGIPTKSAAVHHIALIKDKAHIMMLVDGRKIVDYLDDGKTFGPVYQSGWIGFRQMRWSHCRYKDFKVWNIKND